MHACSIGVALETGRTNANSPVVVDPAEGCLAALLRHAGIAALLPDACKLRRTFRVRDTFRSGCYGHNNKMDTCRF